MREVFRLVGKIALDGTVELNEKLSAIDKRAKQVGRSLNKMGRDLTKIGKGLTKSVTAPVMALGAGMAYLSGELGKYADHMLDLEEITGLSSDTLQELEHVSRAAGVNFDGLTGTISKFQNRLVQMDEETGRAFDTIQKLGIEVYNTDGSFRDMNELFPEIINLLQGMEDTTERNMLAQQLFGRSMNDLAPVLGMTAEEFAAVRKEAHEMGLVMGRDTLVSANEYRIAVEGLKAEFAVFWRQLASQFIPILKDTLLPMIQDYIIPAAEAFAEKIRVLSEWFTNLDPPMRETLVILTGLLVAFGPVLMVVGKLATGFGGLIPLIAKLVTGQLSLNAAMAANPIGMVVTAIFLLIAAGVALWKNWDSVKNFFLDAWDAIVHGVQQAVSYLKVLVLSYIKMWVDGINIVAKYIPGLNGAIESAQNKLQDLIDAEKENIKYRREAREETKAQAKALKEAEEEAEKLKKAEEDLTKVQQEQTDATISQTEAAEDLAEKREQFEKEWSDKLFRETATRIEILEAERKEALAEAEKLGADKADINAYYDQKITEIHNEEAEKRRKKAEEEVKAREDFEKRWSDKVFEETASRLEILEAERKEALAEAEKLGADTTNIEKYYSMKRQEIMDEEAKKAAEKAKQVKEARESFEKEWNQKYFESTADRMEILEAEMQDALAKAEELGASEAAIVAYYEQKKRELRRETFNSYLSTASDILGRLDSIFGQHYTNRNAELDNWYQKQKEVIEASQISEEEKEEKLKELDEERDARKREMARKQAASEKASSLFSIAINTARAAIEALPNLVLSGIITAMGAAQAALVAAEPLPALKTGGLAVGEVTAIVGDTPKRERGELILPMRTGVEMLADMLIGKLSQVALPRPAFAMAGGVSNAYDNRTEVHLHVGTLIADEPGLKKLERKLAEIRLMENRRRGIR